jgi:hypothetical protein
MEYRQFIRRESMEIVLCEWNARKGTWRCSSAPGSPYNRRVDTLSNIVPDLKASGFEEMTPGLRRVGRCSKAENKYVPLPTIESKTPGVKITGPPEVKHPSKPVRSHYRI